MNSFSKILDKIIFCQVKIHNTSCCSHSWWCKYPELCSRFDEVWMWWLYWLIMSPSESPMCALISLWPADGNLMIHQLLVGTGWLNKEYFQTKFLSWRKFHCQKRFDDFFCYWRKRDFCRGFWFLVDVRSDQPDQPYIHANIVNTQEWNWFLVFVYFI